MIEPKVKAGFDVSVLTNFSVKYVALDLTDYGTGLGVNGYGRILEIWRTDTEELLIVEELTKSAYSVSVSIPGVFDLPIRAKLTVVELNGNAVFESEDSIAAFVEEDSPVDSQHVLFSANGFTTGRSSSTVANATYGIGDNIRYPVKDKMQFLPENIDRYILVRRGSTLKDTTVEDSKIIHCKSIGSSNEVGFDYFNEFAVYYNYFCISRITNQILFKSTSTAVAPQEIPQSQYEYGIYIGPEGGNALADEDAPANTAVIVPGGNLSAAITTVIFYKKYFRDLAIAHLAHTDESPSFFYVRDKYSLQAFDDALKNGTKTPAILLERYSKNVTDNKNKNHFEHLNGRFNILLKIEHGKQASIEEAEEKAEIIASKILSKMRKDLGDGGDVVIGGKKLKVFYAIDNDPIDPIGPIASDYYGVTVGFVWRCPFSVAVDEGNWAL